MKEFDYVRKIIGTAESELKLHRLAKAENPYWYSGHKGKVIRAILAAQEELQRIKRKLQEEIS